MDKVYSERKIHPRVVYLSFKTDEPCLPSALLLLPSRLQDVSSPFFVNN